MVGEKKTPRTDSSFEAKLRGKLKKGLNVATSTPSSTSSPSHPPEVATDPSPSDNAIQNTNETPQVQPDMEMQVDPPTQDPVDGNSSNDVEVDLPDNNVETDPDDESDEGDPPDFRGYHEYVKVPAVMRMATIIMHNGDTSWWKNNITLPDGILSPEGYKWARKPNELLWLELAPDMTRRGSLSQIHAIDKKLIKVYKVNEDGTQESTPSIEGTCDDPYFLRFDCGAPEIVPQLMYNINPAVLELRGPERLDTYIPPSELPLWLYVYDEDKLTRYPKFSNLYPDGKRALIDALASNSPLLPIPPGIKPFKYRLFDPSGRNTRDDDDTIDPEENHATLILSKSRLIAVGSFYNAFEGQISLDNPGLPSRLRVSVKMCREPSHSGYMENEGTMYNLFPETFFREYTGVQLVTPSEFPRRLSQVTPLFYGYYKYVEEEKDSDDPTSEDDTPGSDAGNNASQKAKDPIPSSIILTEHCGPPIDPDRLTQYQKLEIVSLVDRIHTAGFILYQWFMVAQPGPSKPFDPLCQTPKWARTSKRPSFRIVDFGHTRWIGLQSERDQWERGNRHYEKLSTVLLQEKAALGQGIKMSLLNYTEAKQIS